MVHKRVLVVGGTGHFGRLLTDDLRRYTDCELVVADRHVVDLGNPASIESALSGVAVAICAAGPFQALPVTLAEMCLCRGIHYIDLADDRSFVRKIRSLVPGEGDNLPAVCTGWSTVPALSGLLARIGTAGLDPIDAIYIHMATGNRLPKKTATIAFCLHVLAGMAMAVVLRHGLETNPDFHDRLNFLVNHSVLWTFAWLTWTAAALAILYFYAAFASAHEAGQVSKPVLRTAVLLTVAAIGPDLAAQAIEIGVLPAMANRILNANTGAELFLSFHRAAVMMSGYVANGLYSLSALILAWSTRNAYPVWVYGAGLAVGCFGLILSAAALMDSANGMFWSNVLLVPSILFWLAGVALV